MNPTHASEFVLQSCYANRPAMQLFFFCYTVFNPAGELYNLGRPKLHKLCSAYVKYGV